MHTHTCIDAWCVYASIHTFNENTKSEKEFTELPTKPFKASYRYWYQPWILTWNGLIYDLNAALTSKGGVG